MPRSNYGEINDHDLMQFLGNNGDYKLLKYDPNDLSLKALISHNLDANKPLFYDYELKPDGVYKDGVKIQLPSSQKFYIFFAINDMLKCISVCLFNVNGKIHLTRTGLCDCTSGKIDEDFAEIKASIRNLHKYALDELSIRLLGKYHNGNECPRLVYFAEKKHLSDWESSGKAENPLTYLICNNKIITQNSIQTSEECYLSVLLVEKDGRRYGVLVNVAVHGGEIILSEKYSPNLCTQGELCDKVFDWKRKMEEIDLKWGRPNTYGLLEFSQEATKSCEEEKKRLFDELAPGWEAELLKIKQSYYKYRESNVTAIDGKTYKIVCGVLVGDESEEL